MQIHLNPSNFFKYYMFHPKAPELSSRNRTIAKVATVALFILTAGVIHLISYAFLYDRNFNKKNMPANKPIPGPAANVPVQVVQQAINSAKVRVASCEIEVVKSGDICALTHDAIVNAANAQLQAGSGVCGAIYQKGGQSIFDECAAYLQQRNSNSVEEGHAMITGGGSLPAKHVIHAVGPVWKKNQESQDKQKLYNAYYNSLQVAARNNLKSIAFPAISTGIFGFPVPLATQVAIQAAADFAAQNPNSSLKTITMAITPDKFQAYSDALMALAQAPNAQAAPAAAPMAGAHLPAAAAPAAAAQAPNAAVVQAPNVTPKANSTPNDLLLPFYRGEGRDSEGRLLQDIWRLNDAEKSAGHDFIQWLFPSFQPSEFNKESPVLNQKLANDMKADPVILANMLTSFKSMLSYYGMRYDEAQRKVAAAPNLEERKRDWFHAGDHNFRRISRILSCLKALGMKGEAKAFYDFLAQMNQAQRGVFKESFPIWTKIVS